MYIWYRIIGQRASVHLLGGFRACCFILHSFAFLSFSSCIKLANEKLLHICNTRTRADSLTHFIHICTCAAVQVQITGQTWVNLYSCRLSIDRWYTILLVRLYIRKYKADQLYVCGLYLKSFCFACTILRRVSLLTNDFAFNLRSQLHQIHNLTSLTNATIKSNKTHKSNKSNKSNKSINPTNLTSPTNPTNPTNLTRHKSNKSHKSCKIQV